MHAHKKNDVINVPKKHKGGKKNIKNNLKKHKHKIKINGGKIIQL
jgi:hypothetical protein